MKNKALCSVFLRNEANDVPHFSKNFRFLCWIFFHYVSLESHLRCHVLREGVNSINCTFQCLEIILIITIFLYCPFPLDWKLHDSEGMSALLFLIISEYLETCTALDMYSLNIWPMNKWVGFVHESELVTLIIFYRALCEITRCEG